jgi:hypothetical protein
MDVTTRLDTSGVPAMIMVSGPSQEAMTFYSISHIECVLIHISSCACTILQIHRLYLLLFCAATVAGRIFHQMADTKYPFRFARHQGRLRYSPGGFRHSPLVTG